MPRKTPPTAIGGRGLGSGFNEAAARCRGKPKILSELITSWNPASMRPRPDAAENSVRPAFQECAGVASMRPRPDAAENLANATVGVPAAVMLQ